jgi:xylitol oxidase
VSRSRGAASTTAHELGATRPRCGKVFNTKPEVICALYERLDEFRVLAGRYDPTAKFPNDFLDRKVPPP